MQSEFPKQVVVGLPKYRDLACEAEEVIARQMQLAEAAAQAIGRHIHMNRCRLVAKVHIPKTYLVKE
jgi:hypothetical protein